MKEKISKGFSGIGSPTGAQRLTPLRETIFGQRASITKICEEVGLQKILQLPSEDTDIQIYAVKVVANLAAEGTTNHRFFLSISIYQLITLFWSFSTSRRSPNKEQKMKNLCCMHHQSMHIWISQLYHSYLGLNKHFNLIISF